MLNEHEFRRKGRETHTFCKQGRILWHSEDGSQNQEIQKASLDYEFGNGDMKLERVVLTPT